MKKTTVTPLYPPNSKVYAYLKDGLQLCTVDYIVAIISNTGNSISYYLKEGGRESYDEPQLLPSIQSAKKKLEENSNQLQIAIGN